MVQVIYYKVGHSYYNVWHVLKSGTTSVQNVVGIKAWQLLQSKALRHAITGTCFLSLCASVEMANNT